MPGSDDAVEVSRQELDLIELALAQFRQGFLAGLDEALETLFFFIPTVPAIAGKTWMYWRVETLVTRMS